MKERRVKNVLGLGDKRVLTVVVFEQRVQMNLKGIDAELKLPLHFIYKLELNVLALGVVQRDERPARQRLL